MKKNYLAQLKDYDRRTNAIHQNHHYARKFINTCYFQTHNQNNHPTHNQNNHQTHNQNNRENNRENNKENIHPNLTINLKSSETSFSSSKSKHQQPFFLQGLSKKIRNQSFSSQRRSLGGLEQVLEVDVLKQRQARQRMEEMTEMKIKCINVQRKLAELQSEQSYKCRQYYQMVVDEIRKQQEASFCRLQRHFHHCNAQLHSKIAEITHNIDNLSAHLYQQQFRDEQTVYKHISKEIKLQMIIIHLNQHVKALVKKKIHELSLFSLHELTQTHQNKHQNSQSKTTNNLQDSKQLMCNEELNEQKSSGKAVNISFEKESHFFNNTKIPLMELSDESQGISPSFKLF